MQSKATLAYMNAISSAVDSLHIAQRELADLKAQRKMIGKVSRPLAKLLGDYDRFNMFVRNDGTPVLLVTMYNLDSFKDQRLVKVLDHLGETMDATETNDMASIVNREFVFKGDKHRVRVSAYVRDDSPTCRKVLVGTELKTVEKYEIVCD